MRNSIAVKVCKTEELCKLLQKLQSISIYHEVYFQMWRHHGGIKNVVCGCSCRYTVLSHPK